MAAQRQSDMAVILNNFAACRHRPERYGWLVDFPDGLGFAGGGGREERQWLVAQSLDRP
jgi:hypothetical protein